jgi:molecular chaperone GrpE
MEQEREDATRDTGTNTDGLGPGEPADASRQDLSAKLDAAERDCAEAKDRYLRLYAEFENYKKRAQRDQTDYTKFAAEKIIKELLPVVDNLERAVAHARNAKADASIVDGLALIVRQFVDALQKSGCEPIETVGKPFDPAIHQALAQVESAQYDADTVVEEAQRGYLLHGRILRPSLVTVSKPPAS